MTTTNMVRYVAVFLLAGACASSVFANGAEKAAIDHAVKQVFPALVRITVVMEDPDGGVLEKHVGAGSGAIIDKEGHIITNHHVAGKGCRMFCRMPDGEEIDAILVGTDALADIAVLKLDLSRRKAKGPLPIAKFGDSDRVRLGDTVLAMGSPMGVSQSVTKGIVSNTQLMMPDVFWFMQFKLDGENTGSLVRWIGHDAVIFGGNSGGPLVNLDGEIIGINEIGLASLGGAIPGNLAKSVADQLIAKGTVDRSWTGLEPQPLLRESGIREGVLVAGVITGSPADQAGIKTGDVVLEYDGVKVSGRIQEDLPVFNALVLGTPIGKKVVLKLQRSGNPIEVSLTTCARGKARAQDVEFKDWGITARDLTRLAAIERKRPDTRGVLVTSVAVSGPAGSAKPLIQADDCIVAVAGKPVASVADLRTITAELTRDTNHTEWVAIEFERGVSRLVTAARPKPVETPAGADVRKAGVSFLLQSIGPELATVLNLKQDGARVTFVYPGGAAEKAGMLAGDILASFDGDTVRGRQETDLGHFNARVRRHAPGDIVDCMVLRDGKSLTLKFALDEEDVAREDQKPYEDKVLDLTLRDLTRRERIQQRLPDSVQGPRIESAKMSGWAGLAHVAGGDLLLSIDGTPTPDTATAQKILEEAAKTKPRRLVFLLQRGVHTLFAEVEPVWDTVNNDNH